MTSGPLANSGTEQRIEPADDLATRAAVAQAATMAASVLRPESSANDSQHNFAPAGAGKPGAGPVEAVTALEASSGAQSQSSGAPRALPNSRDLRAQRRFVATSLADFAVPSGREEEWRFTPLDRLRGLHEDDAITDGKVLIDAAAPAGVVVETVNRSDARLGQTGSAADRVAASAWASFTHATVVTVPADSGPDAITLTVRGDNAASAASGHLLLDVQPFASATVVIEYAGSATYAENIEVRVGDGARLTVVSLYNWADDTVHLSSQSLQVGRDATVRCVAVSLGGSLVRVVPTVRYAGPGGDAELLGLYFADSGQHFEHRLFVDHAVPNCRSNVLYKGALQGRDARTVWIGDVLIRAEADGTDTYEHNRNLLLTDGARADSVPNLEIETGEIVGAGHASATGRFDDEQLFYFMSRGIPEGEARRLVVRGFFAELVQQIGLPDLEERIMLALEAELAAADGVGAPVATSSDQGAADGVIAPAANGVIAAGDSGELPAANAASDAAPAGVVTP